MDGIVMNRNEYIARALYALAHAKDEKEAQQLYKEAMTRGGYAFPPISAYDNTLSLPEYLIELMSCYLRAADVRE